MTGLPVVAWSQVNRATGRIVTGVMKVHPQLGPGLLESANKACLAYELRKDGLQFAQQVELLVVYHGQTIDLGYCFHVAHLRNGIK